MDAVDRKLLNLLQADSRLTADQLGERLHLSPSAITRRIQRLRGNGSIAAEVVVLGDALRARRVTAVVNVQLDRHEPAEAERFRRAFDQVPEVQLCVEITGASDVLLIVSVKDMERFNAFADELTSMPMVRRYETSFVKRILKFTTATPLEEDMEERGF
jgi:Lrp/AsnC family leucine-responsive transcriptional regulator